MKRRYAAVEPETQRAIASEYRRGVHGYGAPSLARKYELPVPTVQSILKRAKVHGDPVTERGHRERKLDEKQERKLVATLDANPLATNRELAAAVGDVITERTASDYVARARPVFTRKVIQDQEPEELTEDWKAAARRWVEHVKKIPLSRRIYADESAIYENEAPTRGRSRKGKPIFRARPRWAKKYTLHVFAGESGVVHWELATKNADTKEIERVAADAASEMKEGEVLIWDRLGRSGRKKDPVSQHYSPVALAAFRDRGVRVEYLPPKGKYFNPLELLFNDLKSHYIRPAYPGNGQKLDYDTLKRIIEQYMNERAPTTLPGFFRARANGAAAAAKKLF